LKKLIFLLFSLPLFALKIVVDTTNDYSVLTMTNNNPFMCKQKNQNEYVCKFFTLPSTPVFSTNSLYFKLTPFFQKNRFYLKIDVKNKSFIKSFKNNLYDGYNKRLKNLDKAKKWVIISYKNKLPFLSNKPIKGLKFPLQVDTDFYLKAIDANGNPLDYDTQTGDVIEYFTILKLFRKKTLLLNRIEDFLQMYPDSIFLADVLYIKTKLLDEEGNIDEVINISKEWVSKYSTNEHLPEVLLLLAKNYANQGLIEDATYIYERLFTEYANSKYAYEGMVYLADQLYSAGDSKRAFELYKQALSNTKDIEVASLSASRIAQRYLDEGNIKESVKYYEKLFKANKQYLLRDKIEAHKLAMQLAKHEAFGIALKITKEIFAKLKPSDDMYEVILYNLAKWSYENKNFQESEKYLNAYLDKFPFGDWADEMKDIKDKILFELNDNNTTLTLNRLDNLIEKYKDSEISQKALLKKGEILYKLKKYKDVLKISKNVELNKSMILNSAKNIVIIDLKNEQCDEAMKYYKEYNVTLNNKFDDKLFKCSYQTRDFNIASRVCNKYLLKEDKIALKWLKNKAKVFEAKNEYKKLALIIDDICAIQKTGCYKWKYKQFFAYYHLNKPNEFLKIASKLKDNIKNIDIFMKVVLYAKQKENNLLVYTYSKKILKLQQKYKTFAQSPFIDFIFVNSAKKLNKKNEAIKVLKTLVKLNIDDENKARAYYMLSSMTTKKEYLQKCIQLKNSKTWKPLCKDSMELY